MRYAVLIALNIVIWTLFLFLFELFPNKTKSLFLTVLSILLAFAIAGIGTSFSFLLGEKWGMELAPKILFGVCFLVADTVMFFTFILSKKRD